MIKKIVLAVLALAAFSYISGVLNLVFTFVVSFALLCYSPVIIPSAALIWLILPKGIKHILTEHPLRTCLSLLFCGTLFLMGRHVINRYYMPETYPLFRISIKIALLMIVCSFSVFLLVKGWRPVKIIFIIIYVLFIIIPTVNATLRGAPTTDSPEVLQSLQSLPYLQWAPAEETLDKFSVTKNDPNLTCKGLNLYSPDPMQYAYLFDMNGKILHTWTFDEERPWPGDSYAYVELLENSDLLVIFAQYQLTRLTWDSRVRWACPLRTHHDFYVTEDGQIHVMAKKDSIVFFSGIPVPLLEEFIYKISDKGKVINRISLSKAVKKYIPRKTLVKIYLSMLNPKNIRKMLRRKTAGKGPLWFGELFDITHANSIELIQKDIKGLCKKGDILLSIRNIDLIGIMDQEKHEFVWTWGPGIIDEQHQPTLLENGNILLFDNGYNRGYSRIIELDPKSQQIVWQYTANPKESFFSPRRGSNQRLPNRNTLITESDRGRIFEVTNEGKVVWEFYNPNLDIKTKQRGTIYRAIRITDTSKNPQLRNFSTGTKTCP